jgi:hypothetical protein
MTKRIPASIRNSNPGAQYPGKIAKKWGAKSHEVLISKDGKHLIATFPTHIQGAAAMFDLLNTKGYLGKTIEKAIARWCGGFYVSTYINVLESHGKVTRHTKLTTELLKDPEVAIPLAKAMALQEAGRDYPMSDEDWRTAHKMAFPDAATSDEPEKPAERWAPDNELPTPKPATRVKQVVAKSNTIRGALVGLFGGIVAAFYEVIAVGLDAAAQISSWAPLQTTFGMIKGLGVALLVGGVTLAIYRRIVDSVEGRS